MKARPTQSRKGVKGDFVPFRLPLAGSRYSVPCGVWGNAPTVPRPTSIANALNKGAGSEASLPVSLRVRRRALKLLFPQDSVKNQMTAIPRRSRQQENGRFLRHAGAYSTIFKHRQLCAYTRAPASLSPLTSAPYFYPIFKFAAQDFAPAGNLTALPPASAAAPACGHPPRPPAWASPTVPPHTADSAS